MEADALNPWAVLHAWCKQLREDKNLQVTGWRCGSGYCALSLLYYKVLGYAQDDLHKYPNYEFVIQAIPFMRKDQTKAIWAHNDGTMDYPKKSFVEIAEMLESAYPDVEKYYKPYAK